MGVRETTGRRGVTQEQATLVRGEHHDPHQVLGFHTSDGRSLVTAFRPDAVAMRVLVPGAKPVKMQKIDEAGLFTAAAKPADDPEPYQLQAEYQDGTILTYDDPYRFLPTLGELDLFLIGEGRHHDLWKVMGAHPKTHQGIAGTAFAVWAPNARSVRVVGSFNLWDGRIHPMRSIGSSGVWELFVPGVRAGDLYKFEILTAAGHIVLKADPFAFAAEVPPGTASVVTDSTFEWTDRDWVTARDLQSPLNRPVSIYEMHLGSWKRKPEDGGRPLTYQEMAAELPGYLEDLGFTHVEFMPVAEHPFSGSWGYQVTGYFAPTSRFGSPDDFRALINALHEKGIGVILDWVPGHFPRDEWALARFDGTALYEHEDPRKGAHQEWGTLIFNYGRAEVRNFLLSNALYWLEEFHADGIRVDGVASMLYLDYSRKAGEWVPNEFGGRENLEAVSFLKELNEVVHSAHPGVIMAAEESTAWPGVSRPTYTGGLGFGFKWNMGWMHDTLKYFSQDPIHRKYHHNDLTFSLLYAFTENFILPLSHDEVVYGKGSLLTKMPGDRWQKAANLRALLGWMWAHPGKQMLFQGGEIAQSDEWSHDRSVDWHLLQYPEHGGVQKLVRELNRAYRAQPALWERDFDGEGFQWIEANDSDSNVAAFLRYSADRKRVMACIANLSPLPRPGYRLGLPVGGAWREVLNTDSEAFFGSNTGNGGSVWASGEGWHWLPHSAEVNLPPLGVLWLAPEG
ncbi:MAG TPA: 1,4-alpha-glucan branching protein GlgB [Actinomycetota bacterium]|nr:1,4-alpha-glucan branching protein GlgB [Actinomycetota bacterium]